MNSISQPRVDKLMSICKLSSSHLELTIGLCCSSLVIIMYLSVQHNTFLIRNSAVVYANISQPQDGYYVNMK